MAAADNSFDVIVIGAGPGGYTAAIRAAQLGLRVACVDDWRNEKGGPALGGTCTNIGCIPSKALLHSSENFENAKRHFADHGIRIESIAIDVEKMLARRASVVRQNNEGILFLFKKNKITFFHGKASFEARGADAHRIAVKGDTEAMLSASQVIVATGSVARPLPGLAFDEMRVLSNDGALAIPQVPRRLGVIGAGVVGLELGSVWRRLGAEVTLLEALPAFLPAADEQIAREALKQMTRQGMKIQMGVHIEGVDAGDGLKVRYLDANKAAQTLECDKLIVSIGRLPNTEGLNGQAVGLRLDERGFIEVDASCRTAVPGVWAIGDVVRGPMLAHKAEEEAVAVAETIAGQHGHVDFETIPWVIYTAPEIAWVGRTEQQAKASGQPYRVGSFPFAANGRARAMGDTVGLVKVVADAKTDRVLGVHAVGPLVSELIAEAVMAMSFQASSEDIARICHAHPTLSEVTREAALAVEGRALNI